MIAETGGLAGTPDAMNALEAMMWRAEVDPSLRSPVVIVDLLDVEPDWERVLTAHAWATRYVPRLRQRVLEPWWGWGTPAWVPDTNFALAYHVRRQQLPPGSGHRDLLDLAAHLAMTPFDRVRPLWEAVVVTGLEGGRCAYVLKVHHSLADGVGLMQILGLLHSSRREHVDDKPDFPTPSTNARSRLGLTAARVLREAESAPSRALRGLHAGSGLLARLVVDPVTSFADATAFLGSLARAAVPPPPTTSPLLRARGLNRWFATLDVDLDELKAAGRAVDATLNDAFLAALLGGLRRYHERFGDVPASIQMGMPVNTRHHGDPLGGNHWAGTRFAVPLDETDPRNRIATIHNVVRAVTGERVVDALGIIAPVLAALPAPLLARVQGGATHANDLQASNVPGLSGPAFVAGAKIERSYAFAPLPGGAVMITLASHQGVCCLAMNLDPAAITEPELFLHDLRAALDETLTLAKSQPVRDER